MLVSTRMERIKELLYETKRIEIGSLVSILHVSEATVRRDLERLEKEGFLYRTHGGAVLAEQKETEGPAKAKPAFVRAEEKNLVGYIASQLVKDRDIIFLGTGSTCTQMAGHLKEKSGLTVVTNNVSAALELSDARDISVILTGGILQSSMEMVSVSGEFTLKMLEGIRVSISFLGVSGVDMNFGYSVSSMEEAKLWQAVRELSEMTVVVCDSSKFTKKSLVKVGDLDCVSRVVTDQKVPDNFKEYYYQAGIPLYTSYELDAG